MQQRSSAAGDFVLKRFYLYNVTFFHLLYSSAITDNEFHISIEIATKRYNILHYGVIKRAMYDVTCSGTLR